MDRVDCGEDVKETTINKKNRYHGHDPYEGLNVFIAIIHRARTSQFTDVIEI